MPRWSLRVRKPSRFLLLQPFVVGGLSVPVCHKEISSEAASKEKASLLTLGAPCLYVQGLEKKPWLCCGVGRARAHPLSEVSLLVLSQQSTAKAVDEWLGSAFVPP